MRDAEDKLYLDLGAADWSTVEITPVGWKVARDAPVWFLRSKATAPLPLPVPGRSIDELRAFLCTRDEAGLTLTVGQLISLLHPAGPFRILVVLGPQGSAKATMPRAADHAARKADRS